MKVKVQAKKVTKEEKLYKTLYVAVPSAFAEILKINEGDTLNSTVMDIDLNGKPVKALVYYK